MSEVVSLRLSLMKRFGKLPKWMQELIRDDMETAFENRIEVMERIMSRGI